MAPIAEFSRVICYGVTVTLTENRIVLVTGGSGGLGRALALAFAQDGNHVIISGRHEQALQNAAAEIGRDGLSVDYFLCDVTRKEHVENLANNIRERLGTVQVLINNAGVARAASFLEMPGSLWEEIINTNLTGTYNCCRVFLATMLQSGWGRIINIASTAAKVGYPFVTAYTASKHGVLGLTRALALETARRGVTVNAICPGYLNNELTHDNARRMAEKTGKTVDDILTLFAASAPQQRLIEPEEVASLALFLTGETSGGITGQAINVDGGAVMV
jgi:NAD(P)-dependent dehydrogenase (short-subunit alcohol dehydrogenase family)